MLNHVSAFYIIKESIFKDQLFERMKKLVSLSFLTVLALSSCGKAPQDFHYDYKKEAHPYSAALTPQEYDEWVNTWSEPGHMYFHYNRGAQATGDDYNKYCLWVWQFEPDSLEGSLWGFKSNTHVSDTLTLKPMSKAFMSCDDVGVEGGVETYRDQYGIVFDVNLYDESLIGGKTGEQTTFVGADSIGFLLPLESSMSGETNWDSDGGAETYLYDFSVEGNWRDVENGQAIHVFVSTGALTDYRYNVSGGIPAPKINPIDLEQSNRFDSTGDYSGNVTKVAPTATNFNDIGVGYQIFVSSFRDSDGNNKGDIRGVIEALPYLEKLGVQCLWLTPVQKSGSYHGYDATDYLSVDKRYGTLDDYKELLSKAHAKGMKVLMDLVLNHTSKSHEWFSKSKWGWNNPNLPAEQREVDDTGINWRNVYNWKYGGDYIKKAVLKNDGGQWKVDYYKDITVQDDAKSDSPSWYRIGESNYYYYGKFGSGMPELNYDSTDTRKLVKNVAKEWVKLGVDGFRLDAVKHIYMRDEVEESKLGSDAIVTDVGYKTAYDDEKGQYVTKQYDYSTDITKNVEWWRDFSNDVKAYAEELGQQCFLVGENFDGWGKRISPYYQALDSQFDFSNFYHSSGWIFNDDGGASNYETMEGGQVASTFTNFETSGDVTFGDITMKGGSRPDFVNGAFTSNHDVMRLINAANGVGDANSTTPDDDVAYGDEWANGRAKFMGALAMLNPGLSWLYYGDELGMTSNTTMHKVKYGNENSMDIWYRQPFLWNDDDARTDYRSGQYKFELDDHNKHLLHNGEGINNYDPATGEFNTLNTFFDFFKAVNETKKEYPVNAKITYEYSSFNVLHISVTGNNSRQLEIFLNNGRSDGEYKINLSSDFICYRASEGAPTELGGDIGGVRFGFSAFMRGEK